jgi:hypothetical protein
MGGEKKSAVKIDGLPKIERSSEARPGAVQ